MTTAVNDWILALGMDVKAVSKGATTVEKIINRISNLQLNLADKYQKSLNAQLKTLQQQEAIITRIKNKGRVAGVDGSPTAMTPRQQRSPPERAPRQPRTYTMNPDRKAANIYTIGEDIRAYESRLGARFKATGESGKILDSLRTKIEVIKERLKAADTPGAFSKVRKDLTLTKAEAQRYERQLKKVAFETKRAQIFSNGMGNSLKSLATGYASVYAAMRIGANVYQTSKALSSVNATLLASSGSSEQAAKDFDFLRQQSKRLGMDLLSSAKGFSQMAVAGKEANLTAEQTKEIYIATAEASTAFALSADEAFGYKIAA